jgi:hypothetical protein
LVQPQLALHFSLCVLSIVRYKFSTTCDNRGFKRV